MTDPLRVLIADDELLARTRLRRLLGSVPDVSIVGECQDSESVLKRVREGGVDVLLLDIDMPGLSGLDAVSLLPPEAPYVIFCTAHPEHALAAFDAGVGDYVVKPVEAARLQRALERARARSRSIAAIERLPIPSRKGIVLLDPKDITHAVLEGELVSIFTANERHLTDSTLQELQDRLEPHGFERVHRRALLHLGRVARLVPLETGGFLAETHAGHSVEISRHVARELRKRLRLRRAGDDEHA